MHCAIVVGRYRFRPQGHCMCQQISAGILADLDATHPVRHWAARPITRCSEGALVRQHA
jgi:hypothetical protein